MKELKYSGSDFLERLAKSTAMNAGKAISKDIDLSIMSASAIFWGSMALGDIERASIIWNHPHYIALNFV